MSDPHETMTPGIIDPRMIYSKEEFFRRTGLKAAAYREAKKNGLRVRYVHKRVFVYGQDWLDYLLKCEGEISH
ncbi:MAG: hypothetical protein KF861_12235 [Planctomycetaceae bacterium]|nr:hypothetical protein [Planctomycetaceae bacterium]